MMQPFTKNRSHQLLLVFLLISLCGYCQENELQRIDNLLSSIYKKNVPGASALISKNGNIIYRKQFGLSNIEFNIPVDETTKFPVGSITKQFTAAAILLLHEQGKLKTSDYLADHLEMFTIEKHPIRIEHLLTHTSGIESNYSAKEKLSSLIGEPLLFKPGSKFDYSNNGYILLGLVIEKTSGLSYKEFLDKHIFIPLKMKETQVGFYEDIILNRASGYSEDNGNIINTTYRASSFSAGAIISTPKDLNIWTTALFDLRIINKKSLSEMLQNYSLNNTNKTNLGFGWEINKVNTSLSYEHSGFEPGYKSNSIFLPKERIHIVILQNTEVGSLVPITINIASIMLDEPYPNLNTSVKLSKKESQRFIGTYLLNDKSERIIGLDDEEGLYIKAQGGIAKKLHILDKNTLFYDKQSYRQLRFDETSSMGYKKFTYSNRIIQSLGVKKSNKIPKVNKIQKVDTTELRLYEGVYKSDQFTMTISLDCDKLFAQPEGSNKLELLPKGQHLFFINEIGAEIEFELTEENEIKQIVILLEGTKMIGIKQ